MSPTVWLASSLLLLPVQDEAGRSDAAHEDPPSALAATVPVLGAFADFTFEGVELGVERLEARPFEGHGAGGETTVILLAVNARAADPERAEAALAALQRHLNTAGRWTLDRGWPAETVSISEVRSAYGAFPATEPPPGAGRHRQRHTVERTLVASPEDVRIAPVADPRDWGQSRLQDRVRILAREPSTGIAELDVFVYSARDATGPLYRLVLLSPSSIDLPPRLEPVQIGSLLYLLESEISGLRIETFEIERSRHPGLGDAEPVPWTFSAELRLVESSVQGSPRAAPEGPQASPRLDWTAARELLGLDSLWSEPSAAGAYGRIAAELLAADSFESAGGTVELGARTRIDLTVERSAPTPGYATAPAIAASDLREAASFAPADSALFAYVHADLGELLPRLVESLPRRARSGVELAAQAGWERGALEALRDLGGQLEPRAALIVLENSYPPDDEAAPPNDGRPTFLWTLVLWPEDPRFFADLREKLDRTPGGRPDADPDLRGSAAILEFWLPAVPGTGHLFAGSAAGALFLGNHHRTMGDLLATHFGAQPAERWPDLARNASYRALEGELADGASLVVWVNPEELTPTLRAIATQDSETTAGPAWIDRLGVVQAALLQFAHGPEASRLRATVLLPGAEESR